MVYQKMTYPPGPHKFEEKVVVDHLLYIYQQINNQQMHCFIKHKMYNVK